MQDFDIYGVFVPGLAVLACVALVMNIFLARLLTRAGVYRLVWHRPLFNLAMYVAVLGLNVMVYIRYLQ
ncbi:DUF1656 domain-containing protein [Pseudodesulfovibrio sp.]|uniref:DUF1656 domain-containing protein n=1 Tax=unclassified Pseudodesulfovibrio TaxID=2661612 RepID=UPI003B004E3C